MFSAFIGAAEAGQRGVMHPVQRARWKLQLTSPFQPDAVSKEMLCRSERAKWAT